MSRDDLPIDFEKRCGGGSAGGSRHDEVTCRKAILDCLLDYESGAMPDELRRELDRHFADCPPCGEFLVSYRATGRTLLMLKPSEVPPALARAVVAFVKSRCEKK